MWLCVMEDSEQPMHYLNLIRVFADRRKAAQIHIYPLRAQSLSFIVHVCIDEDLLISGLKCLNVY